MESLFGYIEVIHIGKVGDLNIGAAFIKSVHYKSVLLTVVTERTFARSLIKDLAWLSLHVKKLSTFDELKRYSSKFPNLKWDLLQINNTQAVKSSELPEINATATTVLRENAKEYESAEMPGYIFLLESAKMAPPNKVNFDAICRLDSSAYNFSIERKK